MIGAEVEHEGGIEEEPQEGNQSGDQADLRPSAAPLRGYPTDSSGSGYHHRATLDRCRKVNYSSGELEFLLALRRLSPPSRKISEFSTNRSAMAVAIVVL